MADRQQRLSYKFQRLRERLREAIETGVLSGKLPGERVLARQFRVNAKTLSKALTDLAAEGLLERTIGRGTFVRGSGGADEKDPAKAQGRWLLLCRAGQECSGLAVALQQVHDDTEVVSDLASLRPSFLSAFTAVIDLHGELPELTLRDLILRNLRVILVDALPKTYSTHSVLIDRAFCAGMVARDLIHQGYRHLYVVEDGEPAEIQNAIRAAARRLHAAAEVRVEIVKPDAVVARHAPGHASRPAATPHDGDGKAHDGDGKAHGSDGKANSTPTVAYLCASMEQAGQIRHDLERANVRVPQDVAVVGIGIDAPPDPRTLPTSGYVVSAEQVADSIRQLINEVQMHRPTPLWLVGTWIDRHSTQLAAEDGADARPSVEGSPSADPASLANR